MLRALADTCIHWYKKLSYIYWFPVPNIGAMHPSCTCFHSSLLPIFGKLGYILRWACQPAQGSVVGSSHTVSAIVECHEQTMPQRPSKALLLHIADNEICIAFGPSCITLPTDLPHA